MSSNVAALRPHHGMCLAYFTGKGYSDGFTAHMGRVLDALTPDVPVRLRVETDVICAACPNNRGGECEQPERTAAYDRAVLDRCGLSDGQEMPFGVFTGLVQERILAPGRREEICGQCQWNEICSGQPSRWEK